MANRDRLDAGQRGLGSRRGRAQQAFEARPSSRLGHGEHTADRPQPPVEAQLADRRMSSQAIARQLSGGRENRQRNRQVEARALLAQAGRRQVDGDPPHRPLQLRGRDAAAHAVLGLLTGAVREPDDREPGHSALEMSLDVDPPRLEAHDRVGDGSCQHASEARQAIRIEELPFSDKRRTIKSP
jgi:hypothetical protein